MFEVVVCEGLCCVGGLFGGLGVEWDGGREDGDGCCRGVWVSMAIIWIRVTTLTVLMCRGG